MFSEILTPNGLLSLALYVVLYVMMAYWSSPKKAKFKRKKQHKNEMRHQLEAEL